MSDELKGSDAALLWRCRRGMRELDLVLMYHLQNCYPLASPEQQQGFRRLLEESDDSLWRYFYQDLLPEDHTLAALVLDIRNTAAHCA